MPVARVRRTSNSVPLWDVSRRSLLERSTRWAGLAVALGLLGAALDQFHVQAELIEYPNPWLWGQAAWVPLNFAVLLTALVAASIPLARGLSVPDTERLAADLAWFVGAYGVSALVAPDHPDLLAVAYVAVWVPRIALRADWALVYPYGVALAVAGCLVEAAEIELGWFAYSEPDAIGVPLWLAGIYLHGAPLALGVARRINAARVPVAQAQPGPE